MRGVLRPMWGYYLLILKLMRVHWFINLFMGLIVPVLVYLIYAQRLETALRARLLVGNVLFSALFMITREPAMEMVYTRVSGQRELLATAGVTRNGYLLATGLYALTLTLLPLGVLVVCLAISAVPAPASWLWTVPFGLAVCTLIATAYALGAIPQSLPTSGLLGNLLVAGSLAFCPLLYPADRVPAVLQPFVALLPPTLSAESMTAAWTGAPMVWWHLPLLAVWTVALGVAGWRLFPWTDTERAGIVPPPKHTA